MQLSLGPSGNHAAEATSPSPPLPSQHPLLTPLTDFSQHFAHGTPHDPFVVPFGFYSPSSVLGLLDLSELSPVLAPVLLDLGRSCLHACSWIWGAGAFIYWELGGGVDGHRVAGLAVHRGGCVDGASVHGRRWFSSSCAGWHVSPLLLRSFASCSACS